MAGQERPGQLLVELLCCTFHKAEEEAPQAHRYDLLPTFTSKKYGVLAAHRELSVACKAINLPKKKVKSIPETSFFCLFTLSSLVSLSIIQLQTQCNRLTFLSVWYSLSLRFSLIYMLLCHQFLVFVQCIVINAD